MPYLLESLTSKCSWSQSEFFHSVVSSWFTRACSSRRRANSRPVRESSSALHNRRKS
jgi:hypothetical protein